MSFSILAKKNSSTSVLILIQRDWCLIYSVVQFHHLYIWTQSVLHLNLLSPWEKIGYSFFNFSSTQLVKFSGYSDAGKKDKKKDSHKFQLPISIEEYKKIFASYKWWSRFSLKGKTKWKCSTYQSRRPPYPPCKNEPTWNKKQKDSVRIYITVGIHYEYFFQAYSLFSIQLRASCTGFQLELNSNFLTGMNPPPSMA